MRKKKYEYNVGMLLDEEMYQILIKVTDKQEVTISKYIRDLLKERLYGTSEEMK